MADNYFAARITGAKEVMDLLKTAERKVAKKIVRKMVGQQTKVIAREAKARVAVASGLYRRSIGRKQKTYPSGVVVGIVGPRRGFGAAVLRDGRAVYSDPRFYAHLSEKGTAPHGGHPGTAAHPALLSALTDLGPMLSDIATNVVRNGLEDAAKKR